MRRHRFMRLFPLVLLVVLVQGCAASVQPKLSTYLGKGSIQESSHASVLSHFQQGDKLSAGLLVINDTSSPESAPALSKDSFAGFANDLQRQLEQQFPVTVVKVLDSREVASANGKTSIGQIGKGLGLNFMVLAIVSSSEVEVPDRLPFGGSLQGLGGRGSVLGFRAENYALVELALLDVQTQQLVVQAQGTAWATLERLNVPLESNVYPVVRRAQLIAPIYPTEDNSHDILRGVAADDALKQAFMHLREIWNDKLSS